MTGQLKQARPQRQDTIFISYRRQEASYLAGWLHDRLASRFGDMSVFLDIDAIKPGVDFSEAISVAISRSQLMLVLVGPTWMGIDEQGHPRLANPDDPVRQELEAAFSRDIHVIPLLLDGAVMPHRTELPLTLARFADLNAMTIGYQRFEYDSGLLFSAIENTLEVPPTLETDLDPWDGHFAPRYPASVRDAERIDAKRNADQRSRLLSKLASAYSTYLDQSLGDEHILHLDLPMRWVPSMVYRKEDAYLGIRPRKEEHLPVGASLLLLFDKAAGLRGDGLLVLGGPGAGKTTLLFELGAKLIDRAQLQPGHPVPVYLHLSTWSLRRPQFVEWLTDQLNEVYQVPHTLARKWTVDGTLLFLLDGLDEIPQKGDRAACVKEINRFNRFGREYRLPMVIATRQQEYEDVGSQLRLESAVMVTSLDPAAVLNSLRTAGERMRAAVAAVQEDSRLLALLVSPLLVTMLTMTYLNESDRSPTATTAVAERRRQLMSSYVHRRFSLEREGRDPTKVTGNAYRPESTLSWLSGLAVMLTEHQESVLLLGRIRGDWLPIRWQRWTVAVAPGAAFGSLLGVIVTLLNGPRFGLQYFAVALLGAILSIRVADGLGSAEDDQLSSWALALKHLLFAAVLGLFSAIFFGVVDGSFGTFAVGYDFEGLGFGLRGALESGLAIGITSLLLGGLTRRQYLTPYRRQSRPVLQMPPGRIALSVGLVTGLTIGLARGGSDGPGEGATTALNWGVVTAVSAWLVLVSEPTERLTWSWSRARARFWRALTILLGVSVATAVLFGLSAGPRSGVGLGLILGLGISLAYVLVSGIDRSLIPIHVTPHEATRRSIRNGFVIGSLSFVVMAVLTSCVSLVVAPGELVTALTVGMVFGVVVSIPLSMAFGLGAVVRYCLVRLLLWKDGIAPLRYVRWLDYAAGLRLLYWGGTGGYMFLHQMLQEHFAAIPGVDSRGMYPRGDTAA